MPVVAVAGGTGGVGKTIVDVLTQEARHEIVVLTRKVSYTPFNSLHVLKYRFIV